MTVGGRNLEEWGLKLPLVLLKQLAVERLPSRDCETVHRDFFPLFCDSDHWLMLFIGTWEVERKVRVIETLVDEVNDRSRLINSNQGPEDLPSRR